MKKIISFGCAALLLAPLAALHAAETRSEVPGQSRFAKSGIAGLPKEALQSIRCYQRTILIQ